MYKLTNRSTVIHQDSGTEIPFADGNADYERYKDWLAAGNTPKPADPEAVVVPASVTMRQARLALLQQGRLDAVNAAVAALPGADGATARIEWEFSSTVERDRPLVQSLAVALGLTEVQLDELFILAGSL